MKRRRDLTLRKPDFRTACFGVTVSICGLFPSLHAWAQPDEEVGLLPATAFLQTTGVRKDIATAALSTSYIQVDRALGALKALGYTVIEYRTTDGAKGAEKSFDPSALIGESTPLPAIIRLPDAEKTSLLDPAPREKPDASSSQYSSSGMYAGGQYPGSSGQQPALSAVPDIGGSYLHTTTSSSAEQRFLVVYDPKDMAALERLKQIIRDDLDVPAAQVVIEAQVVEVRRDRIRDLGVTFGASDGKWSGEFLRGPQDQQLPLIIGFDDAVADVMGSFRMRLNALVSRGEAEILSNPSVLVMDGRQARIQIGQQIPISTTTTNFGSVQESVQYFPVGIVLNLRPRINGERSEVSMQVETIVSSVSSGTTGLRGESGALIAPAVDNRQVQTFVRVADNTPFIIGGLIATEESDSTSGVPLLSEIPGLGHLFRRSTVDKRKSEVIVVITPHIAPLHDPSFSFTKPKDSGVFDSSDHTLFRDTYRIRSKDVFDLSYLRNGSALKRLSETARRLIEKRPDLAADPDMDRVSSGHVPGEEIFVRRMLWETIRTTGVAQHIDPDRIVLFAKVEDEANKGGRFSFLRDVLSDLGPASTVLLRFSAPPEHSVDQPVADVLRTDARDNFADAIKTLNTPKTGNDTAWTIAIRQQGTGVVTPLEWLQGALVLKRIIDLNSTLPLRLDEFHPGRQIVYPTAQDLSQGFHIVDARAARYWYELQNYYDAFQQEFNRVSDRIDRLAETDGGESAAAKAPAADPDADQP